MPTLFRLFAVAALAACSALLAACSSEPATNNDSAGDAESAVNVDDNDVALNGYSVVSYSNGIAEAGSAEHGATHDGVTYWFTSADQKATFEADPQAYVPAYGGWCAYAMARGKNRVPVNPEAFKLVDGRVMLFYTDDSTNTLDLWNEADESQQVTDADAFWAAQQ